jgi:ubiquitin-activating enzyme E1
VIKFTGKYTPINQWIFLEFFETVSLLNENTERKLEGTRYDNLVSIYGNDIQKKLENLNIFIIGAGANGCEFLKNFSLMGISCSKGKITITDNDIVEVSNLNRQFLFQKDNIGDYKSKIACEKAKIFNPNLNIKDYQLLAHKETENIFNDQFWNAQDLNILNLFLNKDK